MPVLFAADRERWSLEEGERPVEHVDSELRILSCLFESVTVSWHISWNSSKLSIELSLTSSSRLASASISHHIVSSRQPQLKISLCRHLNPSSQHGKNASCSNFDMKQESQQGSVDETSTQAQEREAVYFAARTATRSGSVLNWICYFNCL